MFLYSECDKSSIVLVIGIIQQYLNLVKQRRHINQNFLCVSSGYFTWNFFNLKKRSFLLQSLLVALKLPHLTVLYQCAVSAKMTAANSLTPRCTCTHTISSLKTGVFLRCQEACGWLLVAHKGTSPKWPSRRHKEDINKTPPVVSHAGSSPVLVNAPLADSVFPGKRWLHQNCTDGGYRKL